MRKKAVVRWCVVKGDVALCTRCGGRHRFFFPLEAKACSDALAGFEALHSTCLEGDCLRLLIEQLPHVDHAQLLEIAGRICRGESVGPAAGPSADAQRCRALLQEAEAIIDDALHPGSYGPWAIHEDPNIPAGVELLCEQVGYGALLHHVAALWNKKTPGAAHSVAGCVDVRRRWIERAQAFRNGGAS